MAGKKTLVVVWGEQRALRFSRILMLLAYASLMLCTLTGALPLYALLALLTAIPIYLVYGRLEAHNPSVGYLPLMGASMRATIRCGAVLTAALILQGAAIFILY